MRYSDKIKSVFKSRLNGSPLFSFWTHLPDVDRDAEALARETIAFQERFDLDFVKTMPNGMYAIEDYGCEIDFSAIPKGGVAEVVSTPFQSVADWAALRPARLDQGALARELRSLRLLREGLPDAVILFTVFSPMTIAAKLSQGRVRQQIAEPENHPTLKAALAMLAEDTAALSAAAIEAGADGVFFAHQDTGRRAFGQDDFSEFVMTYDLEALVGARRGRFNVLHLHGDDIRFQELCHYPVDGLNWHVWETLPSIEAALGTTPKCLVGGINRLSITQNDRDGVRQQIDRVIRAADGAGDLIVTPGCTIRHGFSPDTLTFIKDRVKATEIQPG